MKEINDAIQSKNISTSNEDIISKIYSNYKINKKSTKKMKKYIVIFISTIIIIIILFTIFFCCLYFFIFKKIKPTITYITNNYINNYTTNYINNNTTNYIVNNINNTNSDSNNYACQEGYYKPINDNKCKKCRIDHCEICYGFYNKDICLSCFLGFIPIYIKEGIFSCEKCDLKYFQHCVILDYVYCQCTECEEMFTPLDGKCTSVLHPVI